MKMNFLTVILSAFILMTTGCAPENTPSSPSPSPPAASIPGSNNKMPKKEDFKSVEKPIVTIEMENGGIIKAELYPDIAPNTVCNFISLINKGFYNGTIFHRVIPGFMIQGGDPQGTGSGSPGYTIKGEFTSNGFENNLKHTTGILSMARKNAPLDSAGCQFFIMVADSPSLDNNYASFGKVTEGMDVVNSIVSTQTGQNDRPVKEQKMKKVTVETFGVEYPEPVVIK